MVIINTTEKSEQQNRQELLLNEVDRVKGMIRQQFIQNVAVYNNVWRLVYNHETFTAEEIFAEIGTDAVELLTVASAFGQAINYVKSHSVPVNPPKKLTPQADGSIKVEDLPTVTP